MFQLRLSKVLKDSFKATPKRPLSGPRQTSCLPARQRCVGAASLDSRAGSSPLKLPYGAFHRPLLRAVPAASAVLRRWYCAKTEGAVELDEQLKNNSEDK